MRKTLALKLIAAALLSETPDQCYGYSLSRITGLKSGTVQPILHRMLEENWVSVETEQLDPRQSGRPPRKLYTLTDSGRQALNDILEKK